MEGGGGREFLPPEPAGPEPELGDAPTQEQPHGWQPPEQAQQAHSQQAHWQAPPRYPAWGHAAPPEPDNGAAVAGFVTSLSAAAVLLMSVGFAGVLTLIAAPFGIHYSRKGKQAVREGRTRKHAGLAQAGFVIGIIVLVLSVLAVVGAILFIIGVANDDNSEPGRGTQTMAALRVGIRLVG